MPTAIWGLLGALLILACAALTDRTPRLVQYRFPGFAAGFLAYALTGARATDHGWIFDATHATLALAGCAWFLRFARGRRGDPSYDPDAVATGTARGHDHLQRYFVTGDVAALDQAVDQHRNAVKTTARQARHLTHVVALLGSLKARYERARHLNDLEDLIDTARESVASGIGGRTQRGLVQALLSTALRLRYDHVGAVVDLNAAREASAESIRLVPFGSRHFPFCSSELARCFQSEYERTQHLESLDLAIAQVRQSLKSVRRGAGRPVDLTMLCVLLAERGRQTEQLGDLDEAVEAGRKALTSTAPTDRLFLPCQNNLAIALRTRFDLRGRVAGAVTANNGYEVRTRVGDLDEAIRLAHRAAQLVAADAPQRADHRLNLALALYAKHQYGLQRHEDREHDLHWALEAARDAATHPSADLVTRIRAGLTWSEIAASTGGYAEAVTAFEHVIELLPRVAPGELRRYEQEDRLGRWAGIASDAAACALEVGRYEQALALLEQGRGVLLSRELVVRADLTALRAANPSLATEFEELRPTFDATPMASTDDRSRRARRQRDERWEELVQRIRSEPGFEDFARPPSVERILEQGSKGPVVYLNVSRYRSDAIIVQPDGLSTWPLRVTPDDAIEQNRRLQLALRPGDLIDPDRQEVVHDVLAWLWDRVAEPVLDAAGIPVPAAQAELPRIWWIPVGLLAPFPIHAAGRHLTDAASSVLDRAISSYAPTVRILAAARARYGGRSGPRPLVVAMSQTRGAEPLGNAAAEAELVRTLFPGSTVLTNHAATRQQVLDELRRHDWVHLACHGIVDPLSPSRGRLLLGDHEEHPLTTADISGLELPDAALAYLSSCGSARTGARHADEALHFATAFQVAGFSDVIATLWSMPDRVAQGFAADTYAELSRANTAPYAAHAVHQATRQARSRYPNLPGVWAGLVHLGR
ncbi:CHAT domain-containing protein [Kribbella pittospori]|uniref:CHAT domain-containing protein n=1 Tax=Kribbella pittospori TaxID=722689 RepID=A0A4R0KS11_9ACTN|nr:CHAT domain-containing protein [Kribbella pittospori]TCC62224.1 CHAT domain-containing protein [Kribbella pittospori]